MGGFTSRAGVVCLDGLVGALLIAALLTVHYSEPGTIQSLDEHVDAVTQTLSSTSAHPESIPNPAVSEPPDSSEPRSRIATAIPQTIELPVDEPPMPATSQVAQPPQAESLPRATSQTQQGMAQTQNALPQSIATPQREPAAVVVQLMKQPGLNKFGNPEGDQFGLSRTGEFNGARLLVWSAEPEVQKDLFTPDNPLWAALREKGFEVQVAFGRFQRNWLAQIDQLWIFAGQKGDLQKGDEQAILSFVAAGRGLYLCADNDPFVQDVTNLVTRLFGTRVTGDYQGENLLAVRGHGVTREDYLKARSRGSESRPGGRPIDARLEGVIARTTHYVEEHPLVTDVNFMYEGITISHIEPSPRLHVVLTASNGQILAAVSRDARLRVVVDCGYTRYLYPSDGHGRYVTETAGTLRYAENIAAYLMYKDEKKSDGSRWRRKREIVNKYQNANLTAILAGLHHTDPVERWAAIVGAFYKRLDVPGPLIELLQDPEADVRSAAHYALVGLANGADFGPGVESDDDGRAIAIGNWQRWRVSRRFLALFKSSRAESVAKSLGAADAEERWAAVMAIRSRKLPLVEELCDACGDLDPAVQQEARLALKETSVNKDFGPEVGASREAVVTAAENWKVWWWQEQEDAAANLLKVAKPAWEKNPSAGRSRLNKIAKDYPKTIAGREAQQLLEK